jgi:hypothetical protein
MHRPVKVLIRGSGKEVSNTRVARDFKEGEEAEGENMRQGKCAVCPLI